MVDSSSNRVLKFSPSGQPIGQWGSIGSKPGEFLTPVGVAVAADGSIYIADQGNYRIQKFSPTFQPLGQWGKNGSDHGQFIQLESLAVDAQGNVLVADSRQQQKYQF